MIDLLMVLLFVGYAIGSGLRARRAAGASLSEYFLAGRSLRGWQAGVSMAATQFAADTPLLVMGLIATGGVFLLWRLWIYGLAFIVMAFVFSGLWRRAGVITDAELAALRYSGRGVVTLRVLKAVYYGTVINCTVLAMVLVAATRIAAVFLPWHAWLDPGLYGALQGGVEALGVRVGAPGGLDPAVATTDSLISVGLIVAFTALYSMTGGLRAVVATDTAQLGFAMVGTLLYAGYVLAEVGGFGGLGERLVAIYGQAQAERWLSFAPEGGEALMPFLVVVGLQWVFQMNSDGTGYLAQRMIACRDDRQARAAGVWFAWLQILARSLIWLVIGVGLLALYPFAPGAAGAPGFVAERELLFVQGFDALLPAGARGVMLVGLLGALASTIDTHLNWGASYWSNDLYGELLCRRWRGREPGRRAQVWAARVANLVILVLAVVVMLNLGSVQEAWRVSLLFGAGTGAVLVLRWLWERINLWAELAAMGAGLVAAPLLLWWVEAGWLQLALMALISSAATVLTALLTRPTAPATLDAFYRQVRPVGAWPHTARRCGDDPRQPRQALLRALGWSGLMALSLFSSLVGAGKLMLRLPGESTLGALAALGLGVALAPLWWRGLRTPDRTDPEPTQASDGA